MKYFLSLFLSVILIEARSQKFIIEKSLVSFYAHATVEDIAAKNEKTAGLFNASTNEVAFSIPIKDFKFAKSLMKEHFNDKYLESDVFPKSTFQGQVQGFDVMQNQTQKVVAKGNFTIHGQTKEVVVPGTIERQGDRLLFNAVFIVKLDDYKIAVPQVLWQSIAEQVHVTVDVVFTPQ